MGEGLVLDGVVGRLDRRSGTFFLSPVGLIMAEQLDEGFLDVGVQHCIYYRVMGAANGVPIGIVHGGPGGAMNLKWGEIFNTEVFKLIYFDQRGCGQSTPTGETQNNTLVDLIEDMEKLRLHLKVDKWILYGGSWGTTLALSYGAKYPENCLGFLLRGIFLGRKEDMKFFLWTVRQMYPEAHEKFLDAVAAANDGQRPTDFDSLLRLTGTGLKCQDISAAEEVAKAWASFETTISSVMPMPADDDAADAESRKRLVIVGLLEHHYCAHELPPFPPLLERIEKCEDIKNLPCWIVHGRLDLVCPATQAVALHKIMKKSKLFLNDGAGHWTFEKANKEKLYECAAEIETMFAKQK